MEISVAEMSRLGTSVAAKVVLTLAMKTTKNAATSALIREKIPCDRSGYVKCQFDVAGQEINLVISLCLVERGYKIAIAFPEEANPDDVFDTYAQITELAIVFWKVFLQTNPAIAAALAEEGIGELTRDADTLYLLADSQYRVGIAAGYYDSQMRPWRP